VFRKSLFGASSLLAGIGAALVLIMMLHVVTDVFLRFIGVPLRATIEIVQAWYMVPVAFLPLAYVEKINGHISVELLSQHFTERAQEWLIAAGSILCALYFAAFTWRTWHDALGKFEVGEMALGDVPVMVWPTRFFLPVGCGLITIFLIYKAFRLTIGDNSLLAKNPGAKLIE
jgi:TRAP-type C4-dicarboxylate transport system permease small subunit